MSTTPREEPAGGKADEPRRDSPLLKIVKQHDGRRKKDELDLDLDEVESDRRYGREDIADK